MINNLDEFYDLIEKIIAKLRKAKLHRWSQVLERDLISGAMAGEILGALRRDLRRLSRTIIPFLLGIKGDINRALMYLDKALDKNQSR